MFLLKRIAVFLCLFMFCGAAYALGISAFEKESDGEASITFCNKIKIINIAYGASSYGWQIITPLDYGGYKNIFIESEDLATKIKSCFQGECSLVKKQCKPRREIIFSKKVNDNTALVKVKFDNALMAVFFLSKYIKDGKVSYRLKNATDFKFTDEKYRKDTRSFIIKYTKALL